MVGLLGSVVMSMTSNQKVPGSISDSSLVFFSSGDLFMIYTDRLWTRTKQCGASLILNEGGIFGQTLKSVTIDHLVNITGKPTASLRVSSHRSLHSVSVNRSLGVYLTPEELSRKPELGNRLKTGQSSPNDVSRITHHSWEKEGKGEQWYQSLACWLFCNIISHFMLPNLQLIILK